MTSNLILTAFLVNAALAFCPNGWTRYDSSCYLFEDVKESWHSSRTYCQSLNGDLAVPETSRENNFIKSFLQKIHIKCNVSDEFFWFGANDLTVENDWIMISNGESFPYNNWAPTEPKGQRNHNCAGYYGRAKFLWDDTGCDAKHQFICEVHFDSYGHDMTGNTFVKKCMGM